MLERSKIFLGISREAESFKACYIPEAPPTPQIHLTSTLVARIRDVPCLVNCALGFHSFMNML